MEFSGQVIFVDLAISCNTENLGKTEGKRYGLHVIAIEWSSFTSWTLLLFRVHKANTKSLTQMQYGVLFLPIDNFILHGWLLCPGRIITAILRIFAFQVRDDGAQRRKMMLIYSSIAYFLGSDIQMDWLMIAATRESQPLSSGGLCPAQNQRSSSPSLHSNLAPILAKSISSFISSLATTLLHRASLVRLVL